MNTRHDNVTAFHQADIPWRFQLHRFIKQPFHPRTGGIHQGIGGNVESLAVELILQGQFPMCLFAHRFDTGSARVNRAPCCRACMAFSTTKQASSTQASEYSKPLTRCGCTIIGENLILLQAGNVTRFARWS